MANATIPAISGLEADREVTRKFLAFSSLGIYFVLIGFIIVMAYVSPFKETDDSEEVPSVLTSVPESGTVTSSSLAQGRIATIKTGEKSAKIQGKDNFDKTLQLLSAVAGILGSIIGAIFGFYFRDVKDS